MHFERSAHFGMHDTIVAQGKLGTAPGHPYAVITIQPHGVVSGDSRRPASAVVVLYIRTPEQALEIARAACAAQAALEAAIVAERYERTGTFAE